MTRSPRSFAHLHCHSDFSMLDGAARLDDLFTRCAELGMPALAMTDHGNMFGAYDFWKKGREYGVNPIIGIESYVAPGSRHERTRATLDGTLTGDANPGEMYTHMTLLAETTEGMHNLFRISSEASLTGTYYKPRADKELLAQYAEGVIATTGCPSGEVQRHLQRGRFDAACQAAADYRDIFGPDNYYVEVMDHGIDIEARVRADLLRLAARLDLPLLATNDSHYVRAADAKAHDVLLCVQTRKTLADPGRFRFEGSGYYLKSPAEMRELFAELPQACDNTLIVAERCQVEFARRDLMPRFPVPIAETEVSWLIRQVNLGLALRYPDVVTEAHRERADYELDLIIRGGFCGYFLVVADLVAHAKSIGIRCGPGRGSGAGSLVAYALGITGLDPLGHGLLFERFLNPERPSMPDFDLDFDETRRGEVLAYVTAKYGADRVAQIVTFSTIKARAAVKDAAKVLHGQPGFAIADRITKVMPPAVMGEDMSLAGIFDPGHERYAEAAGVRALCEADPQVAEIVDTARGLEGLKRQWGVHAAGVIVCSEPLAGVIPVHRRPADGAIVTQFDMWACEALGLLKMDFLGSRNLTIIDGALAGIARGGEPVPDLETLPLDDPAVYDLLARGDTLGVFQLDSAPMRDLLRRMVPTRFGDISAAAALYRPGPMGANAHNDYADRKNNRQEIRPIHPELAQPLADILGSTYGLCTYQEQVLEIAQRVAGYSLGRADLLRKAMGKKIRSVLDSEYVTFSGGMAENGYSPGAIKALWDVLVPFAGYGFNRAHAAAYSLVAYWTAYLKAHYPGEYMAALLTSTADDRDRLAVYLAECRRMGITVACPDVNASGRGFTADGAVIRFGLGAVRDVGDAVVDAILAGRDPDPYTGFSDFLRKVDAVACNRKAVEALIKAGAFDSLGHPRAGLHAVAADAVAAARAPKKREAAGQLDLFAGLPGRGLFDVVIPPGRWPAAQQLALERGVLGLYVSGHPLDGAGHALGAGSDTPATGVSDPTAADGVEVTVAGVLTGVTRRVSRRGEPWALLELEDHSGAVEILVFAKVYAQVRGMLVENAAVRVRARVSHREGRVSLVALGAGVLDPGDGGSAPLVVRVAAGVVTPELVAALGAVLSEYPGTGEVRLVVAGARGWVLRLVERVDAGPVLAGVIRERLGLDCASPS